jgi:UDPglucose 6-dehydrogenase
VELAWNPEFLREGHAVEDTLRPDRIVIGVQSPRPEPLLRQVYVQQIAFGAPFFVTDFATAELAKVAANSFLATKISFINAMAEVCEAAGGDVVVLSEILGADARIGLPSLGPGLGFGGACLPKDIRAFSARASELGVREAVEFLHAVDSINLRCRRRVIELTLQLAGGSVSGKSIGILGAAFKPDSDDIRDSPALAVAEEISSLGGAVTVYDPVAMGRARQAYPELGYAASVMDAAADAEVLLLLTEWPEFTDSDPEIVGKVVAARNVVDGRHALNPDLWRQAGWTYRAPGRPLR